MTVRGWTVLATCLGGLIVYATATWARRDERTTISRTRRRTIAMVVFACLTAVLVAGNGWLMIRWARHGGPFPLRSILLGLVPWLAVFAGFMRSSRSPSSRDA